METRYCTDLFSIVIPCWNHGRLLDRCIQSVLSQKSPPIEVIVIDDGSTDETHEVATSYGKLVTYLYQPNRGLSFARNAGLHHAAGTWIMFIDADDALGPGALHAYRHSIQKQHADLYYGTYQNLSDSGILLNQVDPNMLLAADPFHQLLLGNSMAVHSVLVRRSIVLEESGFDTSLKSHEDWHLWLRLALRGCRFQPVNDALAFYYRGSPVSMSRNYDRMLSSGLDVLSRFDRVHPDCSQCNESIDAGRRNLRASCFGAILLPSLLQQIRSGHGWSASRQILDQLRADPYLSRTVLSHARSYISHMIPNLLKPFRLG